MADNSKFLFRQAAGHSFRKQSGGNSSTSTDAFFSAGQLAASQAFDEGGVNALLAFLAGFNAEDSQYQGVESLLDDLN